MLLGPGELAPGWGGSQVCRFLGMHGPSVVFDKGLSVQGAPGLLNAAKLLSSGGSMGHPPRAHCLGPPTAQPSPHLTALSSCHGPRAPTPTWGQKTIESQEDGAGKAPKERLAHLLHCVDGGTEA